jgi:hypothetical protein
MSNGSQMRMGSARGRSGLVTGAIMLALSLGGAHSVQAQAPNGAYPSMAPIEQYRSASQADEIALARSAAPAAISNDAEILTLGAHGYETAVKGKNGFVCDVELSWAKDFHDPEFWNPKLRAPTCYNRAAARSVLPGYLKRTEWVLAGASMDDMVQRTKAALASRELSAPDVGAMAYMMSKQQFLNDGGGHWHPHLMFFLPQMPPSEWGADVAGGAVVSDINFVWPWTQFFVPVRKWSDGTPGPGMQAMPGM